MGGRYGGKGYRTGASGYDEPLRGGGSGPGTGPGRSEGPQRMERDPGPWGAADSPRSTKGYIEMERSPGGTWELPKFPRTVIPTAAETLRELGKSIGQGRNFGGKVRRGFRGELVDLAALGPWVETSGFKTVCGSGGEVFRCVATARPDCGLNQPDLGDFVSSPDQCLKVPNANAAQGYGEADPDNQWRRVIWVGQFHKYVRPLYETPLPFVHCEPVDDSWVHPRLAPPARPFTRAIFPPSARAQPGTGGAGAGSPELPSPPPPGEKEVKPKNAGSRLRSANYKQIGAATEAKDLVECIWASLPKDCQTKRKMPRYFDPKSGKWKTRVLTNSKGVPLTRPDPAVMASDIYNCASRLSMSRMTDECSLDMLKDMVIGTLSMGAEKFSRKWMRCRPVGLGAGPMM